MTPERIAEYYESQAELMRDQIAALTARLSYLQIQHDKHAANAELEEARGKAALARVAELEGALGECQQEAHLSLVYGKRAVDHLTLSAILGVTNSALATPAPVDGKH